MEKTINSTDKDGAPKRWLSPPPTHCDLCETPILTAFVDGKTRMGPWGCLCEACHSSQGYGLGTGRGQRYEKQGDHWNKTGG